MLSFLAFLFDWTPQVPDFKSFLVLEITVFCAAAWWILFDVKINRGN